MKNYLKGPLASQERWRPEPYSGEPMNGEFEIIKSAFERIEGQIVFLGKRQLKPLQRVAVNEFDKEASDLRNKAADLEGLLKQG